jgi:hypothetical protein
MNKYYQYKITQPDGTFVKVLNPKTIKTEPSFTSRINGGFGQLIIDLQEPFDNFGSYIAHMNLVEITEYDEVNHPSGIVIYTGFISQYTPYFRGAVEGVMITCLGRVSYLNFAYYKNGSSFTVNHTNEDPSDIMKAIIDHFNSVYPNSLLSYTGSSIDTVGTNISRDFVEKKWLDAINETGDFGNPDWWWNIDVSGVLFFKNKPSSATHTFTIAKDVDLGESEQDSEDIINQVTINHNAGTTSDSDATSISTYGTREQLINDTDILNASSAQQQIDKIIAENKDPKKNAKLIINNLYDIESVKVGDTCQVLNYNKDAVLFNSNMQIQAVQYTPDKLTLQLESISGIFGIELDNFVNR